MLSHPLHTFPFDSSPHSTTPIPYNPSPLLPLLYRLETYKLDSSSLKSGEVLVRMLAAPITQVDLAQVSGSAAWPLSSSGSASGGGPRVGGNEGVGIVEAAASGSALKVGDVVIASRGGAGTWATHVVSHADTWTVIPTDASKNSLEILAASVAPIVSAKRMLEGFVKMAKGEEVKGKQRDEK